MNLSREFKIGFFGIAMIGLLYWGINFLKGSDIFTSTHRYYAVYDQVSGLQTASPIVIKGYKVGNISKIDFDPSKSQKVIVEFSIHSKYKLPSDSKARIFSDGLMGGKAVEIELGRAPEHLKNRDTVSAEIDQNFLEVAGNEFEFIKQKANVLINELMVTLENVNGLLSDNRENFSTTMGNVASMTGNLNDIVAGERQSIRSTIHNLNLLSKSLEQNSGHINNILSHTADFTDSLRTAQIPTLVNDLNTTVQSLNTTLAKANEGEGTMSLLLNDRKLYDSLVQSGHSLSVLLEDLKSNPNRYINVTVFGRKVKGE